MILPIVGTLLSATRHVLIVLLSYCLFVRSVKNPAANSALFAQNRKSHTFRW